MTATEKFEVMELLGRIHNLPDKQKERILYVITGIKIAGRRKDDTAA